MELETSTEEQEEEQALISASITDEQLRVLTGSHHLETVDFLQLAVDSSCVPLNTLGERLPRLEQLKLNGSSLPSIRELGTSLSRLRVLWLCRCGLAELDGMSALPVLQELYLAFNDIEKLDSLAPLDQLQVLDLEANVVGDSVQVEWLQFLPALQELTLRGNPVAEARSYRADTLALLPGLELLDDEDRSVEDVAGEFADASPLSSPCVTAWPEGDAADAVEADATAAAAAAARAGMVTAGGDAPATPGRAAVAEDWEAGLAEARQRRQAEERLVSHAIKYAEVGRVYDVSFDGRAFLGGSSGGAAGGARPATAVLAASSHAARAALRSGGSSGPSTAVAGARPATALSLVRPTTAAALRPGINAGYAGMTRSVLDGSLVEDDGSSELTMAGAEVLCGVGALRRNKLKRELATAPAAQPSPSPKREGKAALAFPLDDEALSAAPTADASTGGGGGSPARGGGGGALAAAAASPARPPPAGAELDPGLMDELRALKLQLLLSGETTGELSDEDRPAEAGDAPGPHPPDAGVPLRDAAQGLAELDAEYDAELARAAAAARARGLAHAATAAGPLGAAALATDLDPSDPAAPQGGREPGPHPPAGGASPGHRPFLASSPSKARTQRLSHQLSQLKGGQRKVEEQGYLSPGALRQLARDEVAHTEGADILTL